MSITPKIHPESIARMLATGYVQVSTRGVFEQFAVAYERKWMRELPSGDKLLLPGAPRVVVSACFEPLGFKDFIDRHPNACFLENFNTVAYNEF